MSASSVDAGASATEKRSEGFALAPYSGFFGGMVGGAFPGVIPLIVQYDRWSVALARASRASWRWAR